MKKLAIVLCLSIGLSISSCNQAAKQADGQSEAHGSAKLVALTNSTSADKVHLYFQINETNQTDSSVIYEAKSQYKEDTVGLKVEVLKNIVPGLNVDGSPNGEVGFHKGSVRISSIGAASDNLVKGLGELFQMPTTAKMTSETLNPLVFSSNKDAVDLSKASTYSFKYFFDNSTGKEAELFGVLDTYKKSFELTEKDSTYRAAILATFTGN
ncbi:hypothetical protein ACFRAE_11605 [Sphingobacterium sp. HJSM2_6]|uniref:hypothetical protein n=1 Tax=Sphingobacterium sp. HJSM2_6 TaxID=3366264 RepID=UPI003BD0CAC8